MSRSIERKISKLIKGLQVDSYGRLLMNLRVIQNRIEQAPTMIELIEPHISLSSLFTPQGYQLSILTSHQHYVQLWLFCMKAHLGNLRLRFTPALDLKGWYLNSVPDLWDVLTKVKWVRLEHYPSKGFQKPLLIWIAASEYIKVPKNIQRFHKWVIAVDCIASQDVIVDTLVGIDGSSSLNQHFDSWLAQVPLAEMKYLSSPTGWKVTDEILIQFCALEVLDLSGSDPSQCDFDIFIELGGLKQVYLNDCGLTELPDSMRSQDQLQVLEVAFNPLSELPFWIAELEGLQQLNVAHTDFHDCPLEVGSLSNLQVLTIRGHDSIQTRSWLSHFREHQFTVQRVHSHHRLTLWEASIFQIHNFSFPI